LRSRSIKARISRRGIDSSERLGRHRWVVERTLAWLARYRRLAVRYERRADIHEAFLHLGCSLICLNYLKLGFAMHSKSSCTTFSVVRPYRILGCFP
jgi:hypothetical protein